MSVAKDLLVQVKICDIKQGIPCDHKKCAISRAVARTKHTKNVSTNGYEVTVNGNCYYPVTAKDRSKLERFVSNFDSDWGRRYCRPTTIRLRLEN